MKLPLLEYHAPQTVEGVLDLLDEHGDEAKVIAGGQSLMPMMAMRLARPAQLIDINGVSTLGGIDEQGGVLAFGATTREREAERSRLVAERLPVLAEALPFIGHVSIRNRGTIGGSIAHADASAELPAIALITDAQIVVRSRRGERTIAADDFFVSHYTTTLSDDECLVEVRMPTGPSGAGWSFQEVARRPGDFALVGAIAMVALDEDAAIDRARICLFGVSDRPVRAAEVEAALAGATASLDAFDAAASDAAEYLEPASDMHGSSAYRRHLARVTVRRALTRAAQRAGAPL
jgi:carbon-monoxide dehydrogenase medium subunit